MEAEQSQQSEQTSSKYSTPLSQYQASIIHITNPNDLIQTIELNLRQQRYNQDGDLINISKKSKQLLNEEGLSSCISLVQSSISQNTVMSNLTKHEVKELMTSLTFTLVFQLMINRKKWGIVQSEDRTRIAQLILFPSFICLKRGFEEGERDFWKGSIGEFVHHSGSQGQGKKSFWGKVNPWNKTN